MLRAWRGDLNDQIKRSRKLLAGDHLIPALVADEGQVGNHGVIVAEDGPRSGNQNSDRMFTQVVAQNDFQIKNHSLVWDAGSARHEQFSSNQFVPIVVLRTSVQVVN